jgi:predicted Zn-dependent peptidase
MSDVLNRAVAPALNKVEGFNLPEPRKIKLDNGIPVFMFNGLPEPVFRIDFVFNQGTAHWPKPARMGVFMNMLTEGTRSRSGEDLNNLLDYYGSYVNSSVDRDDTSLSLYGLSEHAEHTLSLMREIFTESTFPENELRMNALSARQSLEVSLQKVGTLASRNLTRELFGSHPYGMMAIPQDYDTLTSAEMLQIAQSVLHPAHLTIFVSGNIPPQMENLLQRYFGDLGNKEHSGNSLPVCVFKPAVRVHHIKEDAVQSGISMGLPGMNRHQTDDTNIQFLNCAFGGYFGSRLMSNIREDKGYTYGIGSGIRFSKQAGYWAISTEVGAEHTSATLREIHHEMEQLKSQPIPGEEFELVRNYLTGSFVRNSDGVFALAERYRSLLRHGLDFTFYSKYLSELASLTPEDILTTANKYLNYNQFFIAVSGPEKPDGF